METDTIGLIEVIWGFGIFFAAVVSGLIANRRKDKVRLQEYETERLKDGLAFKELKESVESSAVQIATLQTQVETLTSDLATATDNLKIANEQLGELRATLGEYETALGEQKDKVIELFNTLDAKNKQIATLEKNVEQKERELYAASQKLLIAETQRDSLQEQTTSLFALLSKWSVVIPDAIIVDPMNALEDMP